MEYTWLAVHQNGQVLSGSSGDSYLLIDRQNLQKFCIVETLSNKVIHTIEPTTSQKVFYRRRTEIGTNGVKEVAHIFGWNSIEGSVVFLLRNTGVIERHDGFVEKDSWLYPIVFQQDEIA